jgi:hypothetical protein
MRSGVNRCRWARTNRHRQSAACWNRDDRCLAAQTPFDRFRRTSRNVRRLQVPIVFFGMLGVTFFGLFLTPVFYVSLHALEKRITQTERVHHHV